MIRTCIREDGGKNFFISKNEVFSNEKVIDLYYNLSRTSFVIIPCMNAIVCIKINQFIDVNDFFQNILREREDDAPLFYLVEIR